MARGWESKSIESQMESAKEEKPKEAGAVSEKDRTRRREREKLLLSRSYVLKQLESTSNSTYCESLRRALADIEKQLDGFKG